MNETPALPPGGLPADFHDRFGDIHVDHSGVDLRRLRRRHQYAVRKLRDERRRRRQLEAECQHLHRALVTVLIRTDTRPGDLERWMVGGGRASAAGAIGQWLAAGGITPVEDNPGDG